MTEHKKGKVVPFQTLQQKRLDKQSRVLIQISDEIDAIILRHLQLGHCDPKDLAGLLAHRLGTLMKHCDGKDSLWEVCERVLLKQAEIS